MKRSIALGVAFSVGVVFPLIFFGFNDPDRAEFSAIVIWFSVVLIPAALIISVKSNETSRLSAVMMLLGIFVGTCVAIVVYYPDKAGLFPIAAAIYTIMAAIPVLLGIVLGSIIARRLKKQR